MSLYNVHVAKGVNIREEEKSALGNLDCLWPIASSKTCSPMWRARWHPPFSLLAVLEEFRLEDQKGNEQ